MSDIINNIGFDKLLLQGIVANQSNIALINYLAFSYLKDQCASIKLESCSVFDIGRILEFLKKGMINSSTGNNNSNKNDSTDLEVLKVLNLILLEILRMGRVIAAMIIIMVAIIMIQPMQIKNVDTTQFDTADKGDNKFKFIRSL